MAISGHNLVPEEWRTIIEREGYWFLRNQSKLETNRDIVEINRKLRQQGHSVDMAPVACFWDARCRAFRFFQYLPSYYVERSQKYTRAKLYNLEMPWWSKPLDRPPGQHCKPTLEDFRRCNVHYETEGDANKAINYEDDQLFVKQPEAQSKRIREMVGTRIDAAADVPAGHSQQRIYS